MFGSYPESVASIALCSTVRRNMKSNDFRLVAARQMVWNKEIWRQPASLGLAIRALKQILENEELSSGERAEVEMLIRKLHAAGKAPSLDLRTA